MEKQEYYIFWVCVCSLRYSACNAHESYCHLWPHSTIFPHYLINVTIFVRGGGVFEHKMCSDFLYNFCLKHFSFKEEMSETWWKMCGRLRLKCPLFLSDVNGTSTFSTAVQKMFKYQILRKSIKWVPICSVPADRQDEVNSRFSQFCEST